MRKTDSSVRLSGPVIPTSNYTVNETRAITGKSRSAIYDAIHKGLLDARKDGAGLASPAARSSTTKQTCRASDVSAPFRVSAGRPG